MMVLQPTCKDTHEACPFPPVAELFFVAAVDVYFAFWTDGASISVENQFCCWCCISLSRRPVSNLICRFFTTCLRLCCRLDVHVKNLRNSFCDLLHDKIISCLSGAPAIECWTGTRIVSPRCSLKKKFWKPRQLRS